MTGTAKLTTPTPVIVRRLAVDLKLAPEAINPASASPVEAISIKASDRFTGRIPTTRHPSSQLALSLHP
jgi:hypothetical protein